MIAAVLLAGLSLNGPINSNEPLSATALDAAVAKFHEGLRLRDQPDLARPCFLEAAAHFETLRQQGARSPALFLNQGNAALLAGDLPQAILSYRRGLRLAPGDPDLRRNLAFARDQVAYPPSSRLGRPPADPWPSWLSRGVARWCLGGALVFYGLGWLSLTRWFMTRRGRLRSLAAVSFLAALLAGAVPAWSWLAAYRHNQQDARHPLVVIARDDLLLRKGNGPAYPAAYDTPLNRGVEARLLFDRGDWLQIELVGGEVGWVSRADLLLDGPGG